MATPPPTTPLPPEAIPPGTELFGYRLEGVLGRGGMGTVYKATQLSLQRPVAVKVLGGRFARNPALAEDFLKEARSTARVTHQNLVMVHDVHAAPDQRLYAYSMEYVPGTTLTRMVTEQGPLKRASALHIVYQIAQALAAAHRADLIHRDIKPDNILVTGNGLAKLLDLGLVRDRLEGSANAARNPGKRMLTIVGTPEWSAPEQSRNPDEASTASDVFSLGATLYFALTGQQPFSGETIIDLIVRVCTEEVRYPGTMSRDCQQLLDLMLAKSEDNRLADGGAVVKALEDVAKGKTPRLDDTGSGELAAIAPGRTPLPRRRRVLRRFRYRR
ncbi:MAG: serine/threonine protein kinase [Planctomycetes bacterium]|nr:serine/threonine protein kinase [Planctomycetota bacterium]